MSKNLVVISLVFFSSYHLVNDKLNLVDSGWWAYELGLGKLLSKIVIHEIIEWTGTSVACDFTFSLSLITLGCFVQNASIIIY